jgi:hypothetical protein
MPERFFVETAAELCRQLSPQCGDNLFAIFSALLLKDVLLDAGADLPVEHRQPGIDRLRQLPAGGQD